MVLDQQIPLERAFAAPLALRDRLGGSLDLHEIASMDLKKLADIFSARPALHRFPAAMASRVQVLAGMLIEKYDGEPSRIWVDANDGAELLGNVKALPG